MKNRYYTYVILIFLLFFMSWCNIDWAQNINIDSLEFSLRKSKNDTSKVNTLNLLALQHIRTSDYLIADSLAREALKLSQKLHFKTGEANSLGQIGTVLYYQNNYTKSLDFSLTALKIDEEIKNKKGVAKRLGNIANVYSIQGNYLLALDYYFKAIHIAQELKDEKGVGMYLCNAGIAQMNLGNYSEALDYYFKSLKIIENSNDKKSIGTRLSNIAIVYNEQGDYVKALEYNLKALKMAEEVGDKTGVATLMGNIGTVYMNKKQDSCALIYYSKALEITNQLNDKSGIARNVGNIANIFEQQGKHSNALDYYYKALKISKEVGDKKGVATNLLNLSSLCIELKKYKDSYNYLYKALAISDSIGLMNTVKECYDNLSSLYEKSNIPLLDSIDGNVLNLEEMRLRSLYYYKKSIVIQNSLFSQENKKQLVQKEMSYEFDKKEAFTKAENDIKHAIAEEKNRKQKSITYLVLSCLLFVLVFAAFIFRSLKITRKQKKIIEQQKTMVEMHQKEILDSINYAKQIQRALLREEEHVSSHLPEHAILFMPKDIVSGDFYWGFEKNEYWYFAVADCTGHGVPGAIMSMLGISFLNDISFSEKLLSPNEILNKLRERIVYELRQSDESVGNRDGMDISLCRLNLKTLELQWAGANNSLNLIRNGNLEIIKADKQPIGYYPNPKLFTNHTIQLQKSDSIYIYSDGYADQFGGEKGKKLTYKRLENLLIEKSTLSLKEQKELLKKAFIDWKGSLEQVDDVCIIGVRV
jgi:serine phosphatase RsbU (regulator of sigma subunit)/Tfp pilus assembly protein PilF